MGYALPPIKLNYGYYMMIPFELFYCKIRKLRIGDHELEKKSRKILKRKHIHHLINTDFGTSQEEDISQEEDMALKVLSSNKNVIVQKANKSNSVVLVIIMFKE